MSCRPDASCEGKNGHFFHRSLCVCPGACLGKLSVSLFHTVLNETGTFWCFCAPVWPALDPPGRFPSGSIRADGSDIDRFHLQKETFLGRRCKFALCTAPRAVRITSDSKTQVRKRIDWQFSCRRFLRRFVKGIIYHHNVCN